MGNHNDNFKMAGLYCLMACLSFAGCARGPQGGANSITTSASARIRIPNSVADVVLDINVAARDLPTTQRTLAQKSSMLMSFLKGQQVDRLMTTNVTFSPETREHFSSVDSTVGYNGALQVSFRTTPEKTPDVLSGALANGASTIESTTFTPTEEEFAAARRDLAAQATRTALSQVKAIAEAAGEHIAGVRQINVNKATDLSRTTVD